MQRGQGQESRAEHVSSHQAAHSREPACLGQEVLDRLARQVEEEALGEPAGPPPDLEPGSKQRGTPVSGEIGGHERALAAGHRAERGEDRLLLPQEFGRVDLEPAQARGQREAESTGVEAGTEEHNLVELFSLGA